MRRQALRRQGAWIGSVIRVHQQLVLRRGQDARAQATSQPRRTGHR